jgi:hypothetical protein
VIIFEFFVCVDAAINLAGNPQDRLTILQRNGKNTFFVFAVTNGLGVVTLGILRQAFDLGFRVGKAEVGIPLTQILVEQVMPVTVFRLGNRRKDCRRGNGEGC